MERCTPLISLIIPVFNVRPYLKQCLESVIGQTYTNLEILIIDDGSTDGSGYICDEYALKDARIKVFHNSNQGLSAARNYGLDHKSHLSEYVAFLDSDDWLDPVAIQTLFEAAYQNQADIVCCRFYYEFISSSIPNINLSQPLVMANNQALKSYICESKIGSISWNKLYRTGLFASVRFPQARIYEDVATIYKTIIAASKLVVVPDILVHYRMRKNSLSQLRTLKALEDRWNANRERFEALSIIAPDNECYQNLVGECINDIGYMWRWYYGFSISERIDANTCLDEMQAFSSRHFDEVLFTRSYSKYQRFSALVSRSRNPILMRVLYWVTRTLKLTQNNKFPL